MMLCPADYRREIEGWEVRSLWFGNASLNKLPDSSPSAGAQL